MARIVTSMAELARTVRRIEIRSKRLADELFSGEYHSSFKGRGIEFSSVREYSWGDDVRTIDWNTTARKNGLYVKLFREERERTLLLMVDGSGSMLFGSRRVRKKELAAEVSAVLAFSALRNNDKVGLIVFTDRVETFIPPRKGRSHVLVILEKIVTLQAASRKTDIGAALSFVRNTQKRRAIVVLVTDVVDGRYAKGMRALNARHDFVLVHLDDPLEAELPRTGVLELRDPESGERIALDAGSTAVLERYRAMREAEREELKRRLRRLRIDTVHLETGRSIIGALDRFFRYREKKV